MPPEPLDLCGRRFSAGFPPGLGQRIAAHPGVFISLTLVVAMMANAIIKGSKTAC